MFYGLVPVSTGTLASVCSIDAVKVGFQTYLTGPHLSNYGTNCTRETFVLSVSLPM